MTKLGKWFGDVWVGLAYFALAAIALLTTRFDNGLAYLWVANAMLITVLGRRRRRHWAPAIAWSTLASFLATTMFGIGLALAPVLAVANMAEAGLAAYILRRTGTGLLPLGSPRWLWRLFLAVGLAGPFAFMAITVLPLWLHTAQDPIDSALRALAVHGLSSLTFIPIFKLFATSRAGVWRGHKERGGGLAVPLLFLLQLVITIGVFTQKSASLLFLPLLPVIAIVFRGSSRWSALSLLLLVVVADVATLCALGPIHLMAGDRGSDFQLLEFYLLASVMTIFPIAAQMRQNDWLAARMRESEARYRTLADNSGDIIMHTTPAGIIRFVSPSIERVGGYSAAELLDTDCMLIIHPDDQHVVAKHYASALAGENKEMRFEYRGRRKDGRWGWFESHCRALIDADGSRGVISMIRDVSDRKEREDALALAALTDPLTGLPNRRAFRDAAARLGDGSHSARACIALLDVDHFKSINDRFGHDVGDEVLQRFAFVARQHLREGDMVARFGGEEFTLLLPDTGEAAAFELCERLRSAIADSVSLTAGGAVRFTISGGVAALGPDGVDAALKRADEALYRAKNEGRDRLIRAAA